MSKNKIIFLIIGFFVFLFVVFIVLTLKGNNETAKNPATAEDFTIWTLNDSVQDFNKLIDDFKLNNKDFKDTKINVVSFSTYEDYYNSLVGAFLNGKGPDLFVLNNNDSSLFDNQINGVDPNLVNPDEFRKNYDIVFSNDLIEKTADGQEYLRGVPLGYEVLGMFYNFRDLRGKKLKTWSEVNDAISSLASEDKSVIGLGNGTTVKDSNDIITQFFLQDGLKSVDKLSGNEVKNSLGRYFLYGDGTISDGNKYDNVFSSLKLEGKNNLDLFSAGDLQIVIGYPRMIEEISKKGFSKSFLRAETFPMYKDNEGTLLANYNYFVTSKNSKNPLLGNAILKYFSTENGQKKYLEIFPYYLPSMLSLVSKRLEENVSKDYVIKYKDFYNSSYELASFNKLNKVTYDKEIVNILDNSLNSQELFEKFRKKLLCISDKMLKQENMSLSCN